MIYSAADSSLTVCAAAASQKGDLCGGDYEGARKEGAREKLSVAMRPETPERPREEAKRVR